MISTAPDYARFLQMYLNRGRSRRPDPLAGVGDRRDPRRDRQRRAYRVRLGWQVAADGAYSHAGSDGTMGWVDPARELIGMVFTQSPGGLDPRREFQQLVNRAADHAAGQ